MDTITCKQCGTAIEVSQALSGQIEAQIIAAENKKHALEIERIKHESQSIHDQQTRKLQEDAKRQIEASAEITRKSLEGERDLLRQQAEAELELSRRRLIQEAENTNRRQQADNAMQLETTALEAKQAKADLATMRSQMSELMIQLSASNKAREVAEFEAQKRYAEAEAKLRQDVSKQADERQRLNLAAKEKTIQDLQRAMDEMQRKAAQGSQQLQGEIMELDFETALAEAFRDDLIEPVAKGIRGGDIKHIVRSGRGTVCGVMLWEIKRTKNWTDSWTGKLKEDLRNEKANVPIIVTEAMPKHIEGDIAHIDGVWICKPNQAVILGNLLRKSLIDVGRERAIGENRSSSAEALYSFVTSHEFVQQIEVMVETYQEMTTQVTKERIAYEKLWAQREKQAQRLMMGTANIIGSMQGQIGAASMPRIKGLELLDAGDEL